MNVIIERRTLKIFMVILLGAALLRLLKINESLATDELINIHKYVSKGFGGILSNFQSVNNHILNSLLVRASSLVFGPSNWAYKLPSFLLSIGAVYLQFWLGRLWFDDKTALTASALLGCSFFHILYSTQSRGYSGLSTSILLVLVFFTLAWREDKNKYWVGLGVSLALGSYFHLFMFFTYLWCMVCGVYLYWGRWAESSARKFLITFAGAAIGTLLVYLPLLTQMEKVYEGYSGADHLSKLYLWYLAGYLSAGPLFTPGTVAYLAFFFLGICRLKGWPKRVGAALFFIIPIALVKYVIHPFPLRTRYFNFFVPVFLLIVAYGITKSMRRRFWVGALLLLFLSVPILSKYYRTKLLPSEDAIEYIQARAETGEWIVGNWFTRFAYYYYRGPRDRLVWFHKTGGEEAQDFVEAHKNEGMWYLAAHQYDSFSDSVFSFRPKWAKDKKIEVGGRSFYFQESFRGMHPVGLTYAIYHSPSVPGDNGAGPIGEGS